MLLALFAGRKIVAREALVGWLRSQGVTSEVGVEGLGLGSFRGQVRIGDPAAPDFVARDVQVAYGLRGLTFEVRSVALHEPVLRARQRGGRLSVGSLDPLVAHFLNRPPQPDTAQPRIAVEGGILILATDYGPIRLTADAQVRDGRLVALKARAAPARLRGAGFDMALGASELVLKTTGSRVNLTLDAPIQAARVGQATASSARLGLIADLPYPDTKRKRLEGPVSVHATLAGGQVSLFGANVVTPRLAAEARGALAGGLGDLSFAGAAATDLRAAAAVLGPTRTGPIRAGAKARDLRWTRQGGDVISATPTAAAQVSDVVSAKLRGTRISVQGGGPVRYGPGGMRASVIAAISGHGAWNGLGPVKAADAPELRNLKRVLQGFQVTAPAVALEATDRGLRVALLRPAQALADVGGGMTLSGRGSAPLVGPGGGFRLAVHGGGLPNLDADVGSLTTTDGAITARGELKAAGSFGALEGGVLDARGALRIASGGVSFTATGCASLTAQRLAFGANDVQRLVGRLCPSGGPMFSSDHGNWRFRAKADEIAATAPFLQARIAGGEGRVTAQQTAGQLNVVGVLDTGQTIDAARDMRFEPVRVGGMAGLVDGVWTGDFKFATALGAPLAGMALRHDTRDSLGGLTINSGPLVFTEGGLQPSQLSPLARAIGSPARGEARFAGHFDWTPAGTISSGTLTIPGLDFVSPAGPVTGLKGTVVFNSLAPLRAPPGQTFAAERLAAIVPVTRITARFSLDEKALTLSEGEAEVGGGRVRVERLSLPLSPDAAMTGVLTFDGVQLHDLVEASPFGDRVDLDAKVSGRVPFQSQSGQLRVSAAELRAIQPGRISINRQALTGVAASGSVSAPVGPVAPVLAGPVPPNDTFTDFAYQAMENLAFDRFEATVASRTDGRLGVLAHIVGRHDPPTRQEIRLSLGDLIRRRFLDKPLPLPSDTAVDLTLDTSLNLDDLLADYTDYRRLRGSPPVQPAGLTTETKPAMKPKAQTPKPQMPKSERPK